MKESSLSVDFGKIWFKENILIAELNEGILFDVESNRKLLQIGNDTFFGQPYGYISHRVNSYAVNPMVYRESAGTSNLKAIAVVTTNDTCRQNAFLERAFYKDHNSFEIFESLDEAVEWIKTKL